jgi:DNA modification methylase
MSFQVITGDALTNLRGMADESVDCCVTSPPYWGLRDYGHAGQMGLEPTPGEYVAAMVALLREVGRVLVPQGTLWLNLGDSYTSGGLTSRDRDDKIRGRGMGARPANPLGLKPKDLVGIPWRVAFALQADGWYLRQDVIWSKPNPMPESVTDRCTKAHEYLFLMTKAEHYFFDHEAIQESAVRGFAGSNFNTGKTGEHQLGRASAKPRRQDSANESYVPGANPHGGLHREGADREPDTRNKRDVWTIPTKPFSGAHFAVMPEALVEPCIMAGCPKWGTVLDPFTGSGTVGAVALRLDRNFIGIELNPEYAALATKRIAAVLPGPPLFRSEPA